MVVSDCLEKCLVTCWSSSLSSQRLFQCKSFAKAATGVILCLGCKVLCIALVLHTPVRRITNRIAICLPCTHPRQPALQLSGMVTCGLDRRYSHWSTILFHVVCRIPTRFNGSHFATMLLLWEPPWQPAPFRVQKSSSQDLPRDPIPLRKGPVLEDIDPDQRVLPNFRNWIRLGHDRQMARLVKQHTFERLPSDSLPRVREGLVCATLIFDLGVGCHHHCLSGHPNYWSCRR